MDPTTEFTSHLDTLYRTQDRAALAHLRQAVYDPTGDPRVFEPIGHALPTDLSRGETDMYLVVACLFAFYIQPFVANRERPTWSSDRKPRMRSMGSSARMLRDRISSEGRAGAESLDQRMTALINSHIDDLPNRLRHICHRLRSDSIPVDFKVLLDDLLRWRLDARRVRRRWAEAYWQPSLAEIRKEDPDLDDLAADDPDSITTTA